MTEALIGIGSNLGDRRAHLRMARRRLAELPETRLVRCSSIYETPPVGPAGQGPYLNAACRLDTELSPHELLESLQRIELEAGRDRAAQVPWGPRTLDLDVLIYDRIVIDDERITLPHPHMHERGFVLQPVCDVACAMTHPILGRTMGELLAEVSTEGVRRIEAGPW